MTTPPDALVDSTPPVLSGPQPRRRALLIIPGVQHVERQARRDSVVRGLENVERHPLKRSGTMHVGGSTGERLQAQPLRGAPPDQGPDVDVFEAYWVDMVPSKKENLSPWKQFTRGLELILYWFHRSMLPAARVSRYITLGLLAGAAILLLWYVGVALLFADALGKDESVRHYTEQLPVLGPVFQQIIAVAKIVGNWQSWACAALLLSFVRAEELADLAHFAKDYLQNRTGNLNVGLRDRLRQRIREPLENLLRQDYQEVVVVAHSFGTVLAVDVLSDWPHREDLARLTLVTWGSPIAVLQCRSRWLRDQLTGLYESKAIRRWLDFYSHGDWLCAAMPGHREQFGPTASYPLEFEASLADRLTGRTHLYYYQAQSIFEVLAGPWT